MQHLNVYWTEAKIILKAIADYFSWDQDLSEKLIEQWLYLYDILDIVHLSSTVIAQTSLSLY